MSSYKPITIFQIIQKTRVFYGLLFLAILIAAPCMAAEELIYEDTVSVGKSTWSGGDISWQHTIPTEILDKATRVEAVVGARDVDFPDCSIDCPECSDADCEHDRLYVNGSEITLLSGSNNAERANPVDIPLSLFRSGSNEYRVVNEVVGERWWVEITESTLRFYQDQGESDDDDGGAGEVTQSSELSIEKVQEKSTIIPGQIQGYTIIVNNTGETDLTGIVVRDRLDSLLEYQSSKSEMIHSVNGDLHTWKLGKLGPGKQVKIQIDGRVSQDMMANQAISNRAEVLANELPEVLVSNTVTALTSFTPVEPEDLRVTKRLNRREGRVGRILSYRVSIENRGGGAVFNLFLEDILPNGFSLVSGSVLKNGQKFADPRGSRRLGWEVGTLAAGARVEISYQVVIGSNVRRGQNINRAEASAVDGGGNKVYGTDEAIVMIGGGDIEIPAELETTVYLDNNDNGLRNSEDDVLENVMVILSNGEKRVSDKDGKSLFEDLQSGYYAVAIDPRSLPEYISVSGDATQLLRIMEGERARVSLSVKKDIGPARLTGVVYVDHDFNGRYDQGEEITKNIKILLDNTLVTRTKAGGRYTYSKLLSGSHLLEIRSAVNPFRKEIELKIGNNIINIPLANGGLTLSVEEN